jgi:integrase
MPTTKLKRNKWGVYEIRWSEGRRSKAISTRTASLPEAKAFRAAFLAAERQLTPVNRPRLGALIHDYLKFHESPAQMWSLKPVGEWFGQMAVRDLHPETVADYVAARLSAKRSNGTIRRELGALVAVINWAVKNRRGVDRDEVHPIAMPPAGHARTVFLDEDVESTYYAAAMGDSVGKSRLTRLTRFVALALDTGARSAAIERLTWDRVDLVGGFVDYRDPGVAASKKRRVIVPIGMRLRPLLERAEAEKTSNFVLDHGGSIRRAFDTWSAGSPAPDITRHDLRRTWASLAVANGVDLMLVAAVLGDSIETVTRHYAHLRPETLRAAVDARWRK